MYGRLVIRGMSPRQWPCGVDEAQGVNGGFNIAIEGEYVSDSVVRLLDNPELVGLSWGNIAGLRFSVTVILGS